MHVVLKTLPLLAVAMAASASTARLNDETRKAYDEYVKKVEARMESPALARLPEAREKALNGEIIAMPFPYRDAAASASVNVPEGLINHWLGGMFIPGASVDQVKAVLSNYAEYSRLYAPEVAESRVLSSNGDTYEVFMRLHRLVRVKALLGYSFPVEFNTNYKIRYYKTGETLQVRSVSTRIAEVRDPKKSHTEEHEVGVDNGYLWRLQSYWRVYPGKGGVFVECEAVSLSRSVPGFVEKMVTYFTTNFPEDSMRHTLKATREAVRSGR